jgi:Ni,Fe-hydrogenase I large subunit
LQKRTFLLKNSNTKIPVTDNCSAPNLELAAVRGAEQLIKNPDGEDSVAIPEIICGAYLTLVFR